MKTDDETVMIGIITAINENLAWFDRRMMDALLHPLMLKSPLMQTFLH